jgi:hypothetical protein
MNWTVEHPLQEGWYWYRERNIEAEVEHVCLSWDETRLEVKSVDGHSTAPIQACEEYGQTDACLGIRYLQYSLHLPLRRR